MMKKLRSILYYEPMEGSRLCLALHWLINLSFLALWSLGLGVVGLYFGKVNYGPELFESYFQYTLLFLLNILPAFVVALVFLLIFNRIWAATLGSGVVIMALALVHHFKLLFRSDPLVASDIALAAEAAQISGQYNMTISPAMWACFATVAAATVFAAFFMKARWRKALPRVISAAALVAAALGLYFTAYASAEVYDFTSNLGVEFASGYKMSQWNETDQYCCRGFLYPLVHSLSEVKSSRPAGYRKGETEELLASYESGELTESQKVNVIAIMLEAYADFSVYGQLDFETDPYEYFHQLQRESVSGELVTNIFAGGTIDTERCFITGATEMYEYRAPADSYARWLAGQGYTTEFCHPGYGWFYNRQNVMEYLGFERVNFFEGRYQTGEGMGILRDDSFFPDLRGLYEEATADGSPYFNFSVTYQNHGPYADGYLYDTKNEYVRQGDLSEESYHILNNYFWGIKLTDDSLRDFVEGFRGDAEPVVIVLFGDHKPWLGDNSSVYAELGIDLSRSSDESFYDHYNTPYLIWANDAAKEQLGRDFSGEGGSFSPCFLMMELFDQCGWVGDGYMQALRELYDGGVDVVNSAGRYREQGLLREELSDSARELLERVQYLQYYRMKEGG